MRALAIPVLAAVAATPSWAQSTFHGNVARTGAYASPGPSRFGGVKWAFKAGGPIVASPAVDGGVVYVASLDGHLHARDQETGKEKGKCKSRMPIASSPASMPVTKAKTAAKPKPAVKAKAAVKAKPAVKTKSAVKAKPAVKAKAAAKAKPAVKTKSRG